MIRLFWQQIPSPVITDIALSLGDIDGVVLDTEHGVWNVESIMSCASVSPSVLIRMKYNEQLIQLAYDNNMMGIIISNVTKDIKFNYGYSLSKGNSWGEWMGHNPDMLIIAQIESMAGIKYITTEGLKYDYYMIGPYDLSKNIGCPGDFVCPQYLDVINQFNYVVRSEKRAVHLVKDVEKQFPLYKDYGMVAFSMDTLAIVDKIKQLNGIIQNA